MFFPSPAAIAAAFVNGPLHGLSGRGQFNAIILASVPDRQSWIAAAMGVAIIQVAAGDRKNE